VLADGKLVVLSLHSQPPDALISVDDEAPALGPLRLFVAPGPHRVLVERQRYASARLEIEAPGHQSIHLSRPPATLRVTSLPEGADVRVDGQLYGVTPLAPTVTAYEQHRVEVTLDGHVRYRRVYVKPPLTELAVDFSRSVPRDTRSARYPPASARPASP
jgi:hypothetical protein